MDYFVWTGFLLSFLGNVLFAFLLLKKRKQPLTTDAKALLSEILSGDALVKISVIDPAGIFYRSPKG